MMSNKDKLKQTRNYSTEENLLGRKENQAQHNSMILSRQEDDNQNENQYNMSTGNPWWFSGKKSAYNAGDCLQYRKHRANP